MSQNYVVVEDILPVRIVAIDADGCSRVGVKLLVAIRIDGELVEKIVSPISRVATPRAVEAGHCVGFQAAHLPSLLNTDS